MTPSRWLHGLAGFTVLALVAAILIEIARAVAGFGSTPPVFRPQRFMGQSFYAPNPAFYRRDPSRGAHAVNWDDFMFHIPKVKPPNTRRVFIIGDGAALDAVPDPAYNFARILEVTFKWAFPNVRFEVYNAAFPGLDSRAVRVVAEACAKQQSDLMVIYAGTDEFQGAADEERIQAYRRNLEEAAEAGAAVVLCTVGCADADQYPALHRANAILASIPLGNGIRIADAAGELAALDKGRPEDGLFYFGFQRTFAGNYVVAQTVLRQAVDTLPGWVREGASGKTQVLSEDECAQRLAFTPAVRYRHLRGALRVLQSDRDSVPNAEQHITRLRQAAGTLQQQIAPPALDIEIDGYRQALVLNPGDPILRARLIQALLERSEDTEALDAAKAFAAEVPLSPSAHRLLGLALARWRNVDEAMSEFHRAALICPEDPETFCAWAAVASSTNHLLLALQAYRQALIVDPQCAKARWGEGDTLEKQGKVSDAAAAYRAAIRLDPDLDAPYLSMDRLFNQQRDAQARVDEWRDTVRRYPASACAHHYLALALRDAGDRDGADAQWAAACAIDPYYGLVAQYAEAESKARAAAERQQQGDPAAAADLYRQALGLDPRNPEIRVGLARTLLAMGDRDAAIATFRETIHTDPLFVPAYDEVDAIYKERGDPDRRVADWRAIAEAHPKAGRAQFLLGVALESVQDLPGAIAAYRRADARIPGDPAILSSLGLALARGGNGPEAIAYLRLALEVNPDTIDARIRTTLISALYQIKDYHAAWREVAQCQARGMAVPEDLLANLTRDSGKNP